MTVSPHMLDENFHFLLNTPWSNHNIQKRPFPIRIKTSQRGPKAQSNSRGYNAWSVFVPTPFFHFIFPHQLLLLHLLRNLPSIRFSVPNRTSNSWVPFPFSLPCPNLPLPLFFFFESSAINVTRIYDAIFNSGFFNSLYLCAFLNSGFMSLSSALDFVCVYVIEVCIVA